VPGKPELLDHQHECTLLPMILVYAFSCDLERGGSKVTGDTPNVGRRNRQEARIGVDDASNELRTRDTINPRT
jgi:hypothetical protein